jgi:hypothetical protein
MSHQITMSDNRARSIPSRACRHKVRWSPLRNTGPRGIRVNAVAPGIIAIEEHSKNKAPIFRKRYA